jgi:hypothetical protein
MRQGASKAKGSKKVKVERAAGSYSSNHLHGMCTGNPGRRDADVFGINENRLQGAGSEEAAPKPESAAPRDEGDPSKNGQKCSPSRRRRSCQRRPKVQPLATKATRSKCSPSRRRRSYQDHRKCSPSRRGRSYQRRSMCSPPRDDARGEAAEMLKDARGEAAERLKDARGEAAERRRRRSYQERSKAQPIAAKTILPKTTKSAAPRDAGVPFKCEASRGDRLLQGAGKNWWSYCWW